MQPDYVADPKSLMLIQYLHQGALLTVQDDILAMYSKCIDLANTIAIMMDVLPGCIWIGNWLLHHMPHSCTRSQLLISPCILSNIRSMDSTYACLSRWCLCSYGQLLRISHMHICGIITCSMYIGLLRYSHVTVELDPWSWWASRWHGSVCPAILHMYMYISCALVAQIHTQHVHIHTYTCTCQGKVEDLGIQYACTHCTLWD
jgi:hypothetical protein